MKIDALSSQRSALQTLERDIAVHEPSRSDADFGAELADQHTAYSDRQLQEILKKIDEQGARLTNTPTYDELKAYRDLVKDFVDEAVGRMYQLHVQAGWDRMGRQKVYTTVRKIDRKLEEVAEKIRMGQTDALDIVTSHDAIRGMLVDLYM